MGAPNERCQQNPLYPVVRKSLRQRPWDPSAAAKATKYKNPINEVGVTEVFGIDAPDEITAMSFVAEHSLTPDSMIAQLKPSEQWFFRRFFAGKLAKKIYRLYEYRT